MCVGRVSAFFVGHRTPKRPVHTNTHMHLTTLLHGRVLNIAALRGSVSRKVHYLPCVCVNFSIPGLQKACFEAPENSQKCIICLVSASIFPNWGLQKACFEASENFQKCIICPVSASISSNWCSSICIFLRKNTVAPRPYPKKPRVSSTCLPF